MEYPEAERRRTGLRRTAGRFRQAAQRLKDLAIWVFHAADDSAMPVERVVDGAVAAMNRAGRREPARYTRYRRAPPPDPQDIQTRL